MNKQLHTLREEVEEVLIRNILPYWMERMTDYTYRGFYGRVTGEEELLTEADKGAVLHARILWTFSAAYRLLGKEEYKLTATHAKRFLIDQFYDRDYGGVYWAVDYKGEPVDVRKQIYALGFAIYGLSEYHRATADTEALTYAIHLFESIERHSFDRKHNGYLEALTQEWCEIQDMRLSEKDANERKTMNTHLHILESYTNLYRVWQGDHLKGQLHNLIVIFCDKILDSATCHLNLFFDDTWQSKHRIHSYGHDIEASWLLHEAALVLGDEELLASMEPLVKCIADAASEGYTPGEGMIYEKDLDTGHTDRDRHWWVQAEAIVGYINLYQHFGDKAALEKAVDCWVFIRDRLVDRENGEWFWAICADGSVDREDDKAGFWKCPYHNGRMCMELIERFAES